MTGWAEVAAHRGGAVKAAHVSKLKRSEMIGAHSTSVSRAKVARRTDWVSVHANGFGGRE
jgi:hypothetical protein